MSYAVGFLGPALRLAAGALSQPRERQVLVQQQAAAAPAPEVPAPSPWSDPLTLGVVAVGALVLGLLLSRR